MSPRKLFARCFPSLYDLGFLAPAILLFCVMAGAPGLLADSDTGWHIRSGDWILDHHRLPTFDFFSFTKSGQPWYAWEWLWEVSFSAIHRYTGMAGVILGCVLVLCLTSMLLLRIVRRRLNNDVIAIGVIVVAVLGMSIHFLARPHLFSFLFAAILVDILDRRRDPERRVPWIVAPLFVIWANVHPGFLAGIIILCGYTAGELASALTAADPDARRQRLARFRQYLMLTGASILAPLVNPYGYRLYAHMYSFLTDSYVLYHVNEYKVVDFRSPPGRAFELMLLLGAPAAISRLLKRDFTAPILFLGWAHLALTSQRNIPFFMIVAAAPVALWLEEMRGQLFRSKTPDGFAGSEFGLQSVAATAEAGSFPLLGIGVVALIFVLLRAPGSPPKFHPQYDSSVYPEQALAAVRGMGASTRMITTDIWGGYLIYEIPGVRVFWDGRTDFYGTPYNRAAADALMGRPGWNKTLAEHRITAALLPVDMPLNSLLGQSKEWHAVYRDEVAVLFQSVALDNNSQEPQDRLREATAGLRVAGKFPNF
jgi:hypothetical protein